VNYDLFLQWKVKMHHGITRHLSVTILLIVSFITISSQAIADKGLSLGSVAMDTPAVMHKRLSPLTQYLTTVLGVPVKLKLSSNMSDAINDVANGRVDIAYLTPVAYIRSHQMGQTKLIAKAVTNGKASLQLMIVAGENTGIKTLADLKGKRFAFGDRAALLQRAIVVGSNTPLETFGSYDFLGHLDNIVRSILHGDYDAGILKDTKALKWKGKGIRIIYESQHLPPFNLAASNKLSNSTIAVIKNSLFSLNIKKPSHLKIVKALDKNYDGFSPAADYEYDVIRELIMPFENK